jgi:hypothetical protein
MLLLLSVHTAYLFVLLHWLAAISFPAGVPIIADKPFMGAYTMIERSAVYYQVRDRWLRLSCNNHSSWYAGQISTAGHSLIKTWATVCWAAGLCSELSSVPPL